MSLSPSCSRPHSWRGTDGWSPGRVSRRWVEGNRDGERQSSTKRDRDRTEGERYRERAKRQSLYALTPNLAPAVLDSALPTTSPVVPMSPARPTVSPHHSGWATVKRRCRRMLWFTRSFLKSPGEPRGEPRGELGTGAGADAGGPCIAKTAWRLDGVQAARDLFWTTTGAGPGGERAGGAPAPPSPQDRSGTPSPGQMGKPRH